MFSLPIVLRLVPRVNPRQKQCSQLHEHDHKHPAHSFDSVLTSLNSYKDIIAANPDDFVIIGFPCNQFASQDPGSNDEIQEFCQVNYGVTFPILGKVDVNGDKPEPVWDWLKNEQAGVLGIKRVKWNFEKFLIGRDGKVKGRWASTTKPEALEKFIKEQRE